MFQPPDLDQDLSAIVKSPYYIYNTVNDYDNYFKKYTEEFFNFTEYKFDYLYFKAQSIAESNLNPDAESPVGAMGLMQIMPSTYKEISKKIKLSTDTFDPRYSIKAGIYYMSTIWKAWKNKRTWLDHWDFCTASYNAGRGNIIRAQKLCSSKNLDTESWSSIVKTLPLVTGRHSKETITYVERIKRIRNVLIE